MRYRISFVSLNSCYCSNNVCNIVLFCLAICYNRNWLYCICRVDCIIYNVVSYILMICLFTENAELLWCQFCHQWWHCRLSLRQRGVPPVMTKLTSWQLCFQSLYQDVFIIIRRSCYDANSAISGGTAGCHYDNVECHQWWQSWHHDNSVFRVCIKMYSSL